MACIYIYKNHTFNSENELDDFIMDLLPFESKYGDLVFQVTVEQTNVIDKVTEINDKGVSVSAKDLLPKPEKKDREERKEKDEPKPEKKRGEVRFFKKKD